MVNARRALFARPIDGQSEAGDPYILGVAELILGQECFTGARAESHHGSRW
jgi:hypothetical protein